MLCALTSNEVARSTRRHYFGEGSDEGLGEAGYGNGLDAEGLEGRNCRRGEAGRNSAARGIGKKAGMSKSAEKS